MIPLEPPPPTAPPGTGYLLTIVGWLLWIVIGLCFVAAVICLGQLAFSYVGRGTPGEHAKGLVVALVSAAIVGGLGAVFSGATGITPFS